MNRVRAALTALVMFAGVLTLTGPSSAGASTLKFMAMGDSITAAGQWQLEFSRLLDKAGVDHVIVTEAVGGVATNYWPSRIDDLMEKHNPDYVLFFTGTNDNIGNQVYGESETSYSWRATVEAIANRGGKVLPAFIQYSDPLLASDWLIKSEPVTNDRIYREINRYSNPSWAIGNPRAIADFQRIPSTGSYLDDGGIHPNERGYKYMGRIVYDAMRPAMGWPHSGEPRLCDLYGHRRGYARPTTYEHC